MKRIARIIGAAAFCGAALTTAGAFAASHREAPLIANDPTADNTDFYLQLTRSTEARRYRYIAALTNVGAITRGA